ncbi:phosphatidylcholine and lysophosphatidylcholine phospholipase [Glugoides intestinalis]
MPSLLASVTFFVTIVMFYFLCSLSSRNRSLKKSLKIVKQQLRPKRPENDAPSISPFLIFNSIKVEKTYMIQKGSVISKNFYIVEGQVEVIFKEKRIGVLKAGQITHNCFDVFNIDCGIIKKALSDILVGELPEKTEKYVNLKFLEKTCFEPALRLCKNHEQIASLETIKTNSFEEFALKEFGISYQKIETIIVEHSVDLEDRIYYVESGFLVVNNVVFEKGSVFGYFGVFFNYYKGFRCTTAEHAILKYIPYNRIKYREINREVLSNIPKFMIYLGATTEWKRVSYGQAIFEKDARCEDVYLVDGVAYGCKESMLKTTFENSLIAEKTVDVIKIPKSTIELLLKVVPGFYGELTERMFSKVPIESKIVLITPAAHKCEVFVQRLKKTLGGEAIVLKNTQMSEILGRNAFNNVGELVVSEHLNRLRENYKAVIIYLENEYSRLLKIVHPYSDIIFLVGTEATNNTFNRKNVEFVKLYERRTVKKKSKETSRVSILTSLLADSDDNEFEADELESRALQVNPLEEEEEENTAFPRLRRIHNILSPKETNFCNKDYERISRYILGERVGLVLGGGGARGYAHIGVIQALEEENIPIDVVGGTSMGALIGALYSRELDYVEVYTQAKKTSKSALSYVNILMDFTIPFVSMFSGRSLDRSIKAIFKDQQIQNFWLEYYCVTTSLKTTDQVVHFGGSAYKYVRSSMTVAGLLPPVFYKDDILCDGAYVNNIPTDIMESLDVKKIISVKVCRDFDNRICRYDSVSGLVLFIKSILLSKTYLTLPDIQYRLSFLSSKKKIEKLSAHNLVIKPDLGAYKPSDFHKFDEIVACGYEAAKTKIKEWKLQGKIKEFKKKTRRFSI